MGVALLGFLFPVIWTSAGLYLSSNLLPLTTSWQQYSLHLSLPQVSDDIPSFVIILLACLIYISFIIRMLVKRSERTSIVRRRITICCYLVFLLFVSAFFSYDFYEHLLLLAVPMAALISYYYNEDAEIRWMDYLLLGCFMAFAVYSFLLL